MFRVNTESPATAWAPRSRHLWIRTLYRPSPLDRIRTLFALARVTYYDRYWTIRSLFCIRIYSSPKVEINFLIRTVPSFPLTSKDTVEFEIYSGMRTNNESHSMFIGGAFVKNNVDIV